MNNKKTNIIIIVVVSIILFILISITQSCSKINFDFFGLKSGEDTEEILTEGTDEEENEEIAGETEDANEEKEEASKNNDISDEQETVTPVNQGEYSDILVMRSYFKKAIESYENQSYLAAEYYLNKIKDSYLILQDHIYYYMAKSLLMQEKYDRAEEYYSALIDNYPESVLVEKASLEYADLFYIKEDYVTAENRYAEFCTNFSDSPYMPYCLFQLAFCQEKTGKKDMAYENYKEIWLSYPLNEYSEFAIENLDRLYEEGAAGQFIPSPDQIYNRGEVFFNAYLYDSALDEFNRILKDYSSNLPAELHIKTLFKSGMCYFRLRDYNTALDYIKSAYEKNPSGSLADDSLYYTGMALTSLDRGDEAISYYNKLAELFPNSNFSDDALYRIGRIYSLRSDFENAAIYFKRVASNYPSGDKRPDALWELGLIQYRSNDYGSAKSTFSSYAYSYRGTSLEEKGLFWQAKCCQKLGDNNLASELYQKIINLNYYSYYTFAAVEMLEQMGIQAQVKGINNELNPENPSIKETIPDIYSILAGENDDSRTITESNGETGGSNHINKAIELLKLEFFNSASLEIEASSNEIEENPIKILEIATLYLKSRSYSNSINIIGKNLKKLKSELDETHTDYLYYLYYPYAYKEQVQKYSSYYNIDPLFTLAVIRQESNFRSDAVSYAGAQGLMQIMPSTGEGIARQIGMSDFDINMLIDPEVNVKMGTFYLRQQLDNFGQNKFYCLGAYNGGPGRMSGWVSSRGNMDIDEFIESISYEQSREYIKKVMGNYYFYQILYETK